MKRNAFTLLEMIVVVMIISILFLLTVPNVTKVIQSVDAKACNAMTKVIDTAIVQYKLDHDSLPSSIQDLVSGGYITESQTVCSNGKSLYLQDGHAVHD
ncbi:MAG: prepilin-type N-terminal cleavage/methylation domain-containing protein [Erysipelotrichaceae bacterium]|nr:prepilin-type N-terminal cleavage/methylation domain-containing protein [Erysipelotrichaceae bacterium]